MTVDPDRRVIVFTMYEDPVFARVRWRQGLVDT